MITVKDIREKEFSKQKHGYHEDEVDDFLDEIADQMEELIRENRSLLTQLDEARDGVAAAPAEAVEHSAVLPPSEQSGKAERAAVDEPSYFKNLETTLRETLLSAQRIADSTVAEARNKAKDLVAGAEEQAKQLLNGAHDKATKISQEASTAAQSARTELENLRKSHEDYKGRIMLMIKEQIAALKLDEDAVGIKSARKLGAKDATAPEEPQAAQPQEQPPQAVAPQPESGPKQHGG